jgi:hypothetical protein
MRRFVYLGFALGSTVVLAGAFATSCYRVPTPVCGFRCGAEGECPTDYTCSSFEDRCHLNGSDPAVRCDTIDDEPDDAPPDAPRDVASADAADDAPFDGADDAATDAVVDAP